MIGALLDCLLALAWCVVLLVSLAGWGAAWLRVVGLRRQHWSICAGAGVAAAVLVGGMLNALHLVRGEVLWGFVGVGVALALWLVRNVSVEAERGLSTVSRRAAWLLLAAFALVLAVRVVGTVHTSRYQNSDDLNAYLVLPEKMLERHTLEADPFSERRVTSAVGPGYFLQALELTARPLENMQMADRALGLLLLGGLCWPLGRRLRLGRRATAGLALLAVAMPVMVFNLTYVQLPFALFLCMALVTLDLEESTAARSLLLGALAAVMSGLKSTYLPPAVLLCLLGAALLLWSRGMKAVARAWGLSVLGFLVVLTPWLWKMRQDEGTFLYPLLGRGFDYTAYHVFLTQSSLSSHVMLFKIVLSVVPLFVVLAVEIWALARSTAERTAVAMTTACLVGTLAVGVGTGGDSIRRYCYPCIAPTLLIFFAVCLHEMRQHPGTRARLLAWGSGGFAVLFAVSVWMNAFTEEWRALGENLALSMRSYSIEPAPVGREYAAMEAAAPPDGVMLESLRLPFLLDFKTHRILLADFPAAASPPPGWPVFGDGEALAGYLKAQGIRYLAYSYGDCGSLVDSNLVRSQGDTHQTAWVRSQSALALLAHGQYAQLALTRRHIYDDGSIYVLDLDEAAPAGQVVHMVMCDAP